MKFELPEEMQRDFDPLLEEFESIKAEWKVPLEKLEALVDGDEGMEEMLEDVLDQCVRYTATVLEEQQTLFEEGRGKEHEERDYLRSITHTATQDTLRAFVRNLVKRGKTKEEIYPLLPNTESRSACGQFAVRLTLSRCDDVKHAS